MKCPYFKLKSNYSEQPYHEKQWWKPPNLHHQGHHLLTLILSPVLDAGVPHSLAFFSPFFTPNPQQTWHRSLLSLLERAVHYRKMASYWCYQKPALSQRQPCGFMKFHRHVSQLYVQFCTEIIPGRGWR